MVSIGFWNKSATAPMDANKSSAPKIAGVVAIYNEPKQPDWSRCSSDVLQFGVSNWERFCLNRKRHAWSNPHRAVHKVGGIIQRRLCWESITYRNDDIGIVNDCGGAARIGYLEPRR